MCPPSVTEALDALQLITDPLQGTLRERGPPNKSVLFFSGITFASFRAQSCEECCEESFEECCEECCEECASHCSITVDFQQDVDFPTEMRGFQVRDATRH